MPRQSLPPAVRWQELTGDASTRSYARRWDSHGRSLVEARYTEASRGSLVRDLEVLSWLAKRGLRVPEVVASDVETMSVIFEDFGHEDAELYQAAATLREDAALFAQGARRCVRCSRVLRVSEFGEAPGAADGSFRKRRCDTCERLDTRWSGHG